MYLLVPKQLVIMSLLSVVSFAFSKKFKYGRHESEYLSKLLLFVISPCMIFNTFNIPFTQEKLSVMGLSLLLGFITLSFMIAVSLIAVRSKTDLGKSRDCLDKMAFTFSNAGFIGIPLINGVFGPEGVFPLMGYVSIFNIFLWTVGFYMVNKQIGLKKIITNPNIIAIIAGFILFLLPFELPEILGATIKYFGDLNTPVSMIILGILFADFKCPKAGDFTPTVRLSKTILFRLILLPIFLLLVYKFILTFIFMSELVKHVMMIIFIAASCPVGMNVANFAVIYNKDESYASLLVSASSLICVISLPLIVKLAEIVL